jgi:integrase
MHGYVLFMANTGLRPDEASRLEYRDVKIVTDEATEDTILEIEVRGKRGVGYCKSMPGAVRPFRRLNERNRPQPTDRLFPKRHRELFNIILDELKLKFDRDRNRRTAYSLRHTCTPAALPPATSCVVGLLTPADAACGYGRNPPASANLHISRRPWTPLRSTSARPAR